MFIPSTMHMQIHVHIGNKIFLLDSYRYISLQCNCTVFTLVYSSTVCFFEVVLSFVTILSV